LDSSSRTSSASTTFKAPTDCQYFLIHCLSVCSLLVKTYKCNRLIETKFDSKVFESVKKIIQKFKDQLNALLHIVLSLIKITPASVLLACLLANKYATFCLFFSFRSFVSSAKEKNYTMLQGLLNTCILIFMNIFRAKQV
jgi:hypothetical protein